MEDIGVVCGRFQIFHLEHLQYVLAAKKECRCGGYAENTDWNGW